MPNTIDAERVNPATMWQRRDGGGNPGKHLIETGKESRDLLMRTYLKDMKQVVNVVNFRDYLREFSITEDDAIVQDLLALLPSIGGLSRFEFVEATTGLMMDKNRSKIFGGKGKNDKSGQQPNS